MVIRNLMTGAGFEGGAYSSQWISAWVALGILGILSFLAYRFFVKMEMSPAPFSFAGSLIGPLAAILILTFTPWVKVGFIVGFLLMLVGGFILPRFTGGE